MVRLRKLRRSSWRGARGKVLEEKINSCPVGKSQRMSILALFLLMIPYGMEIDMSAVINSETPASWALRGDVSGEAAQLAFEQGLPAVFRGAVRPVGRELLARHGGEVVTARQFPRIT